MGFDAVNVVDNEFVGKFVDNEFVEKFKEIDNKNFIDFMSPEIDEVILYGEIKEMVKAP